MAPSSPLLTYTLGVLTGLSLFYLLAPPPNPPTPPPPTHPSTATVSTATLAPTPPPSPQKTVRWPWKLAARPRQNTPPAPPKPTPPPTHPSNKSEIDIGAIFGMDVGGTLSKLIYFERRPEPRSADDMKQPRRREGLEVYRRTKSTDLSGDGPTLPPAPPPDNRSSTTSVDGVISPGPSPSLKRVTSLQNLAIPSHVIALDQFYNFARTHDTYGESGVRETGLSFYSRKLGGELHFIRFNTHHMQNALELISRNSLHRNIKKMGCTGGGAHKYSETWKSQLDIEITKIGEMDCLVAGLEFVLASRVGECYTFKPPKVPASPTPPPGVGEKGDLSNEWSRKVQRDTIQDDTSYPYIVVSIGTGVSFIRVDGPGTENFVRVGGSTIGGGTYWGLCRLLTDVEQFEDVLALAERGDSEKVDMLVKDIYGTNKDALTKLKLPGRIVASSFGKLVSKERPAEGLEEEDIARALLMMTTNNIAHIAHLTAQLYKTSRIYFVGNFLRHNNISCQRLSYSINYWSGGEVEALFLEHEGFLGALGAFLLGQDEVKEDEEKDTASPAHTSQTFRRRSQSATESSLNSFVNAQQGIGEEDEFQDARESETEIRKEEKEEKNGKKQLPYNSHRRATQI